MDQVATEVAEGVLTFTFRTPRRWLPQRSGALRGERAALLLSWEHRGDCRHLDHAHGSDCPSIVVVEVDQVREPSGRVAERPEVLRFSVSTLPQLPPAAHGTIKIHRGRCRVIEVHVVGRHRLEDHCLTVLLLLLSRVRQHESFCIKLLADMRSKEPERHRITRHLGPGGPCEVGRIPDVAVCRR